MPEVGDGGRVVGVRNCKLPWNWRLVGAMWAMRAHPLALVGLTPLPESVGWLNSMLARLLHAREAAVGGAQFVSSGSAHPPSSHGRRAASAPPGQPTGPAQQPEGPARKWPDFDRDLHLAPLASPPGGSSWRIGLPAGLLRPGRSRFPDERCASLVSMHLPRLRACPHTAAHPSLRGVWSFRDYVC